MFEVLLVLFCTVNSCGWRLNEAGSWEFSELYYRCNRMLVDMLNPGGPALRPLSLPKRHIQFKHISRNVAPRPHDVSDDRRRLQKLPIFLYNSAPESEILSELKDTVSSRQGAPLPQLHTASYVHMHCVSEKNVTLLYLW